MKQEHTSEHIYGDVANVGSGSTIGLVKVIMVENISFAQIHQKMEEMNEGEILVSSKTDPSLIQACQKAAAIVTDVGGFLTHAAIISRELGIPCIVGTKTATQVLKDGDEVEVDAKNGVVRILKRAL